MNFSSITKQKIEEAASRISRYIIKTPFLLSAARLSSYGINTRSLGLKLELFQNTGTFKARGVINTLLQTPNEKLVHGIVTASGGNHGVAVAWGAKEFNIHAKIVMPSFANKRRQELCRFYGAEVIHASDLCEVFNVANTIQLNENRFMLHPFEGEAISEATATIGKEICDEVADLDYLLVPVGGGGLISGIAAAMSIYSPRTQVIGVEPFGADAMFQSFQRNQITTLSTVNTIADSLGSPMTLPYSFALSRQFVSEIVRVTDSELNQAMVIGFEEFKLALEPASASTIAALMGPLRRVTEGKNVGLVICGANNTFERTIAYYQ